MENELNNTRLLYAACASFSPLSANRLMHLVMHCGSIQSVFTASYNELSKSGLSPELCSEFISFRSSFSLAQLEHTLLSEKIRVIIPDDCEYPAMLVQTIPPPAVLFVKGILAEHIPHPLAIVGSRKMTHYGERILDTLLPKLVQAGCSIISGLALGCDGFAHETTLKHNGYTIAVLGSGLDSSHIYPRHHVRLAHKILESGGALISEYPPGTPALPHHFPARNRIIAGLSYGVLLVEAATRSGSLITARLALEQGKQVFAVPGSIFAETSAGCNALIAQGARPVLTYQDILEEYGLQKVATESIPQHNSLSEEEKLINNILSSEGTHIDDIITQSKLATSKVMILLTMLEAHNRVQQISGMRYIKL